VNRTSIAGYLLLAMILLRIVSSDGAFLPIPITYPISGMVAFLAAGLLFKDVRSSAKLQVSALFFLGVCLLLYTKYLGGSFVITDAFSRNTQLLTMVMSVGFLKLLIDIEPSEQALPTGRKAFLNTLMGLGIFGSAINLSAPLLVCDRIAAEKPIDLLTARSISRVFCACSCWSPYFGGTALVLTLVEGVSLLAVMITGLPLLIATIIATYQVSIRRHSHRISKFSGYPMSRSKLWLPIALTLTVVATQAVFSTLPILVVISASALGLSIVVLCYKLGVSGGIQSLSRHVEAGLPKSANELLLFLSAGVLATGLTAYLNTSGYQIGISEFTYSMACLTLAGMILISAAGIHPVVQISVLTPLLLPINPNPNLLAVTYLFCWALGNAASPLSGTHLVFQGRYGVSAWQLAKNNWAFVFCMYFVAIGLLWLLANAS